MSCRVLTFHLNIVSGKTFTWVPAFFTLWSWPWSVTYFLKRLTLLITFEKWMLELWYFIWVFYESSLSIGTNDFDLVTLNLEFDLLFENFDFANNFWTVNVKSFYISTEYFVRLKLSVGTINFLLWNLDFLKILTLVITVLKHEYPLSLDLSVGALRFDLDFWPILKTIDIGQNF